MSNNFNQVIEEILGNLNGESSIGPTIQGMFQTMQPEEIHAVIEKLKHKIAQKNESLRVLLSNNHQHLFACTDLVDQLSSFSSSAKDNHDRLEKVVKAINQGPQALTPHTENLQNQEGEAIKMEIDDVVLDEYF